MSFLVIPAIDLKRGRCVRLVQGRAENETVFSEDPVATALQWQAQGAPRLHVVDLDGAWAGAPAQAAIVRAIIGALSIPVQVGGGLRDRASVEQVLEAGARWAVIGTRAALDPTFLGEICRACEERIIVSVDASDGRVAVDGWTRVLDLDAVALVRDAAAAGAAAILYTDIARDGTQEGPNLWSTEAVAKVAGIAILASGGVSCLDDLRQLAGIPGVEGAIVGRALYSGAVDLRRALAEVGG
ncbi:MAG: 1-(5-phosphoribosyl)-5-[(5-phosphoribosylamino)methylideneamino]imidazole-4-carboxamide isomerase [Candidatus Rokubacteria bacterium GWC2_70_24]|nr:MAG: 1-(5-phosphoribosyl)-5-[(5-phosphoribosylamino)methylideneamino]imidazole-4-carboxamide isomerase [Candidatus Rokubacteria bacterium GWA2_70_23]OGK86807.1 MAG: 1-(5-phosphoribosyl)-5-[(5-phosphoribosylamino)methylideneamino]imidazole-4-carboxamide isomerase [Candidatus Rokubacteria bacterium GWC2_70_24]OGK92325.1 MAG: 1-(5-phosphoribosyl)-5-[(5-phosphoribosylamino)methylideneamino]imidazole-4-carboxamide isomerase [Candidatus Rokubacteria bacterium GWF2_70_14]HAM58999.1 1-(5-phosphoribos